jgi:imidazolonepropionase-like amidohydrolase
VAAGKQADLILVDGKPDEDITQLSRIDMVWRDGIAYDPKKLIDSVRGRIGR